MKQHWSCLHLWFKDFNLAMAWHQVVLGGNASLNATISSYWYYNYYKQARLIQCQTWRCRPARWDISGSLKHLIVIIVNTKRVKKGKVAPYSINKSWARSWSRPLGNQPTGDLVINPTVGCHYFPPGPWLSFQPKSIIAPWLSQVVKGETRQNATMDKIYTDLAHWYSSPEIKPPVANSDHNSVLSRPSTFRPRANGFNRLITRRSISTNGKALLAPAIAKHKWNSMYHLQSVDDMLRYFYSIIYSLLDTYLPLC